MDSCRETELLQRLQKAEEQNGRLAQENALLRQKIDLLVKRLFGARSEKLDAAQLELLLGLGAEEPGKVPASSPLEEALPLSDKEPSRRRRKNEPRWPAHLQVIEEVTRASRSASRATSLGAASARKSANSLTMNPRAFCAGG